MYKIAIVGDRDSIYGFATLGIETFPVQDANEGEETLRNLANSEYAIIFITESLQSQIRSVVAEFNEQKLPAIIPIPGVSGNTGEGMENVQKLVVQAVGSDIIFNQ